MFKHLISQCECGENDGFTMRLNTNSSLFSNIISILFSLYFTMIFSFKPKFCGDWAFVIHLPTKAMARL